jgi:hypothetical protein
MSKGPVNEHVLSYIRLCTGYVLWNDDDNEERKKSDMCAFD